MKVPRANKRTGFSPVIKQKNLSRLKSDINLNLAALLYITFSGRQILMSTSLK